MLEGKLQLPQATGEVCPGLPACLGTVLAQLFYRLLQNFS